MIVNAAQFIGYTLYIIGYATEFIVNAAYILAYAMYFLSMPHNFGQLLLRLHPFLLEVISILGRVTYNGRVFAKAGNSLLVQPGTNADWKTEIEDNN